MLKIENQNTNEDFRLARWHRCTWFAFGTLTTVVSITQALALPERIGLNPSVITTAISGLCFVLGACLSSTGLKFRLFSQNATRVEVCLFRKALQQAPVRCLVMARDPTDGIWQTNITPKDLKKFGGSSVYYGYRVWGPNWPYDPTWRPGSEAGFIADVDEQGHRFNPNKLTLDPYALEISHGLENIEDMTIFETGSLQRMRDSALVAPKGVVLPRLVKSFVEPKPNRALRDDVIYEVHVKGFTKNDPSLPQALRGTYKGAAMKAGYLKELGVTAVEFLPVQQKVSERHRPNYWGYMTLGYFSPERSYAFDQSPDGPSREFRAMVEEFHRHGIKVIMDVVYNHTGEGGVSSENPALASIYSFRGIDNASYYDLSPNKAFYMDNTGCGHNFATFREPVRQLVMDSLKYWKEVMGVDGFRFDLASVLGNVPRGGRFYFDGEDPRGILKRAVAELPGVDLIAEPWAIGEGTFQQGHFPEGWSEWNAEGFRDRVRSFFNKRGIEPVSRGAMANAISGSAGLFRKPSNTINFVTAHDGFTLRDLFSYNSKQNNQPWPYGPSDGGEDNNRSWDQGGDPRMQRQVTRNALMTLLLSSGTPQLLGGDEFYRSQRGNNNPWNMDSAVNYLPWETLRDQRPLFEFVQFLLKFRRENPVLRQTEYYSGRDLNGNGLKDLSWYSSEGRELNSTDFDRTDGFLAYRLDATEFGSTVRSIYVAINADFAEVNLRLPAAAAGYAWHRVADTAAWFEAQSNFHPPGEEVRLEQAYTMKERCELLLVEKAVR